MKLTDKEAIKIMKRVRCCELEDMISDYPESDRDGRTDMEMIANEAFWLLDAFCDYDTAHHEDLEEAYEIVRDSRRQNPQYDSWEIQRARDCINEFNRLKRFVDRCREQGLIHRYWSLS